MWFGRGTRFLLTRGEYGEILTGTASASPAHAGWTRLVGSTDVSLRAFVLSGQTWPLVCRGIPADLCKRKSLVTRELSILRSALARGPPNDPQSPTFKNGFAKPAATIRRFR